MKKTGKISMTDGPFLVQPSSLNNPMEPQLWHKVLKGTQSSAAEGILAMFHPMKAWLLPSALEPTLLNEPAMISPAQKTTSSTHSNNHQERQAEGGRAPRGKP